MKKSSRVKRRLEFPTPEDAPSLKVSKGPLGPKAQSRKASKGPLGPKGPTVRIVTKLDKAYETQTKVDKRMKKMMWSQKKLRNSDAFLKSLQSKPQRIANVMFEVLTKEELVAMAKKLAANCAQDALEEVLQRYRYIALEKVSNLFPEKCREAMTISADLTKLRHEVRGPTEDVAAATGPKEEADAGVIADSRRGWRVKHGNSTIGRFDKKEQACEAYYDYCKRYGLL